MSVVSEDNCKLCKRNKLNFFTFLHDYEYNETRFDNNLCFVCNVYEQITGVRKTPTDFDLKKLNLAIFFSNKFYDYYNDEKRIQQRDDILIWKNDKYLKDWYNSKYGKDSKYKYFKRLSENYFDNAGDFFGNEFRCKLKSKKHIIDWVLKHYFVLKNEIGWH